MKKLLFILIAGLIVRILWISICPYKPAFDYSEGVRDKKPLIEEDGINIYAKQLTQGKVFEDESGKPQCRRPIGYPIFLGFLYKIFGASHLVLWISNLVFYIFSTLLVYALGERLFNTQTGILAAGIFSFYPNSVYSVAMALDEHLAIFLLLAILLFLTKGAKECC